MKSKGEQVSGRCRPGRREEEMRRKGRALSLSIQIVRCSGRASAFCCLSSSLSNPRLFGPCPDLDPVPFSTTNIVIGHWDGIGVLGGVRRGPKGFRVSPREVVLLGGSTTRSLLKRILSFVVQRSSKASTRLSLSSNVYKLGIELVFDDTAWGRRTENNVKHLAGNVLSTELRNLEYLVEDRVGRTLGCI